MNTKKWRCKDGRKIRIKDMDDSHLMNTIRFLERQHRKVQAIGPPCFQGEMAQMCADQEYDALLASTAEDIFPILYDMKDEQARRGLK